MSDSPTSPVGVSADTSANSSSVDVNSDPPSPSDSAKPPRRKRKSTFIVRKEEKEQLLVELAELEAKWTKLHAAFTSTLPMVDGVTPPHPQLKRMLQDRHLSFVGLRSMMTAYFATEGSTLPYDPIHLPLEPKARRAALLRVSDAKIRDLRALIAAHCRCVPLGRPHSSTDWFETDKGEPCLIQFDVTPLRTVRSTVRDVFDACGYYAQNVEIYASERLGTITIREDEDDDTDAHHNSTTKAFGSGVRVSQRRIVSATTLGFTIDANVAVLRQYVPAGMCPEQPEEHAVIVAHSVESDALYPYVPQERVRFDLYGGSLIVPVDMPDGNRVVSIVRSSIIKMRRSGEGDFDFAAIPDEMQQSVRILASQWSDLMLHAVSEQVRANAAARESAVFDAEPPSTLDETM